MSNPVKHTEFKYSIYFFLDSTQSLHLESEKVKKSEKVKIQNHCIFSSWLIFCAAGGEVSLKHTLDFLKK